MVAKLSDRVLGNPQGDVFVRIDGTSVMTGDLQLTAAGGIGVQVQNSTIGGYRHGITNNGDVVFTQRAINGDNDGNMMILRRDEGAELWHGAAGAKVKRFETTTAGGVFSGNTVGLDAGASAGRYQVYNDVGGIELAAFSNGNGALQRLGANGVLTNEFYLFAEAGGQVQIMYNNIARFATNDLGFQANGTQISIANSPNDSQCKFLMFNQGGGGRFVVQSSGTNHDVEIQQTDSDGTYEKRMINCHRNGAIDFYHDGLLTFKTNAEGGIDCRNAAGQQRIVTLQPEYASPSGSVRWWRNNGAQYWSFTAGEAGVGTSLDVGFNGTQVGNFNSGTGNYTATSLRKFKTNITAITGALDIIKGLRPSTYTMNGVDHAGYVAEEIADDLSLAAVYADEDSTLRGVDHQVINTFLLAAVQELILRLESIENA